MGKILIPQGHGATQFYRLGWARALNVAGYDVNIWQSQPAFDIFNQIHPNIVFCGTWELDQALLKCIKKWNCQVWLWGSTHGDFCHDIDDIDPVQTPTDEELKNVESLLDIVDVKHIYSYYHNNQVEYSHGWWERDFDFHPVGIPLAADVFDYSIGTYDPLLECDIAFVGGMWPYKSKHLEEYLYPIAMNPAINMKIFGTGNWRIPQHLGTIDTPQVKDLIASAVICPNIYEPLSIKYGIDVNERVYKILSAGGICVSQRVASLEDDIFPNSNAITYCDNAQHLIEILHFYKQDFNARLEAISSGIREVYSKHTYMHRAIELLQLENANANAIDDLHKGIKSMKRQVQQITGVTFP